MISVIIVNYNTSEILEKCIESVYEFEKKNIFEIIIVDNASDKENMEALKRISERFNLPNIIYLGKRVSFSEANNIGFEASSKNGYTLIMNPDIIFTNPLFEELIKITENNREIGAVCPLLTGDDGGFQRGYFQRYPTLRRFVYFDSMLAKFFDGSVKRRNKYLCDMEIDTNSASLQYVEQIPCAFFFTTAEIFEGIGKMDTSYELFFEDVDLSYRIHKTRKLAVAPFLNVRHVSGASFRTEDNWWMHGRFIMSMINFFNKHYGEKEARKLECFSAINSRIIIFLEIIKSVFGQKDEYRMKKHSHFLKLLKENK